MRSLLRPLSALALASTLALAVTGCGAPQPKLQASDRLESLLLTAADYPDGYSLEPIDVEDVTDTTGSDEPDSVEPAACARFADGGAGGFPEEAPEAAAHTAIKGYSGYVYVLASGDLGDDVLGAAGRDALLRECSEMTITTDGIAVTATLELLPAPSIPGTDGMLATSMAGEGMEMTMTTAWGRVGDVYFLFIHMDMDLRPGGGLIPDPDLPTGDSREECLEEDPVPCMTEAGEAEAEQADAEAHEAAQDEFEDVLAAAVERLGKGA